MRMKYRGDWTPNGIYKPGDIVAKGRRFLVVNHLGELTDVSAPADPSCIGPAGANGRHGIDGKNGRDGDNGRDGRDGVDGKDGKRGKRGEKGEAGATYYQTMRRTIQGSSTEQTITALFAQAAAKGMPLFIDGSAVNLAVASGIVNVVGVAAEDVATEGRYQTEGQVERTDWTPVAGVATLTPGAVYFLDDATPGRITATAPTTPDHVVLVIGRALSATMLDVEIGNPILLDDLPPEE